MFTLEGLWLYQNQLVGPIPAELGRLRGLKWLSLQNNGLGFQIPSSLGQLRDLLELELGSNQLTGAIPTELDSFPGLRLLQLEDNNLRGEVSTNLCTQVHTGQLEVSVDCSEVTCGCGCTCNGTPPPVFAATQSTSGTTDTDRPQQQQPAATQRTDRAPQVSLTTGATRRNFRKWASTNARGWAKAAPSGPGADNTKGGKM